jgi:hypothetical protein
LQKTSLNESFNIKANDGDSMIGGNMKLQEPPSRQESAYPNLLSIPQLPRIKTFAQQGAQCEISEYKLKDNLYLLEKKGDRFLKLKANCPTTEETTLTHIITHSLG